MVKNEMGEANAEVLYTFKCKHTAPWHGKIVLKDFWTIPFCPECRQERIETIPKARDMYDFVTVLHHMLDIAAIGKPHIPVLKYCNAAYPVFFNGGVRVNGTGIILMPAVGQWEVLSDGTRLDVVDESDAMVFIKDLVLTDDNIAKARIDFFNGKFEGGMGFEQSHINRTAAARPRAAFCCR